MHYYKFNISDWQSSTRHLSLEEEAIYFRLINHYYDTEKPIPLDTQSVIRRLMLGSHVQAAELILAEFFEKTEKGYVKNKCDEIIKDYKKTNKKNKENGRKGGRPKGNAACSVTQDKPSGLPVATQDEPSGNPNYELLTTNHKPLTINQEPVNSSDIGTVSAKPKLRAKFSQPELMDVYKYLSSRGINQATARIESEKFTDHYSSNGWKVGKNPMKDWKASVRNWTKNITASAGVTNGQPAGHQQPKPSLVDRVKQQAEQRLRDQEASTAGHREFGLDTMAQTDRNVRVQVCEPVRGDARGDVDNVLNGDYWQTDGGRPQ